jgi:hypothetical protein
VRLYHSGNWTNTIQEREKKDCRHFLTREEAEAAALDAAQVQIDSRGPLS